jgi:hypothetical protein
LDWALALVRLHRDALDAKTLEMTMGCILKLQDDWELLRSLHARYAHLLTPDPAAPPPPPEADYGLGSVHVH